MTRALIGYTGFVGGNLHAQADFSALYNSKNFNDMRDQSYDMVVCAGVSAVKWKANKEPEADLQGIKALTDVLDTVRTDHFVLISTIDVYPDREGKDEDFDCGSQPNHAYGRHRLWLENHIRTRFAKTTVIRLPGLFGNGLKKNIIFDLMHDKLLEKINPACSFQYYNLDRLWADIERVLAAGIPLINLFGQPLTTARILERCFPDSTVGAEAGAPFHYDLHTKHAGLFDVEGPYVASADQILDDIEQFVKRTQP